MTIFWSTSSVAIAMKQPTIEHPVSPRFFFPRWRLLLSVKTKIAINQTLLWLNLCNGEMQSGTEHLHRNGIIFKTHLCRMSNCVFFTDFLHWNVISPACSRDQGGLFQNRWSGSHCGSLSVTAMLAAASVQSGVPHVIKTWLIFRTLLLTISATNGDRERASDFQQPVNFKVTTCHPLTWPKQEVFTLTGMCFFAGWRKWEMWKCDRYWHSKLREVWGGHLSEERRGGKEEICWKTKSESGGERE